jgi:hypothetical protein
VFANLISQTFEEQSKVNTINKRQFCSSKKVLITPQILNSGVLVQLFQTPAKFAQEILLCYFLRAAGFSSLALAFFSPWAGAAAGSGRR